MAKKNRKTGCVVTVTPDARKALLKLSDLLVEQEHRAIDRYLSRPLSNRDLGRCPHGCEDDEGCDEPGCPGGPSAYDDEDEDWDGDEDLF